MSQEIKEILIDLYGETGGLERYSYLTEKKEAFLKNHIQKAFDKNRPYDDLKGEIFVIAYPDNVYDNTSYPLQTLQKTLKEYFPSIGGIHILPERTMSHNDVWPQDFFAVTGPEQANAIVNLLIEKGILFENRILSNDYPRLYPQVAQKELKKLLGDQFETVEKVVKKTLHSAWNSHFNDGGFSQKTRAEVDPRFGRNNDLKEITENYKTMLDFVVNHLDVDNEMLDQFRKGNNEGEAFVIIYRDKYKQLQGDRILEKTFRPRPFPLFTGMRKYPVTSLEGEIATLESCSREMNRIYTANELEPLDERVIQFMSIYFKIENDQGLTSQDKRLFSSFETWAQENQIDLKPLWLESEIQAKQKKINLSRIPNMEAFIEALGYKAKYADLFMNDSDHIFGREFYVYTTFSESQADVNPITMDGFKMIIDDLFYLLSSGSLTMMRMDAIKYLWKEIGKKNFDMEEGNKLIAVIRQLMEEVTPEILPLDEINSPDAVVYEMAKNGGFAYLFGQVNAVPVSFNEGSLQPLVRFNQLKEKKCPKNLLPFVMLSTHDGRSVQGIGVQRTDGHVSVQQFYNLKDIVESRGGKPKFRSVAKGEIAEDTFLKVFKEAGFENDLNALDSLFLRKGAIVTLKDQSLDEADFLEELSSCLKVDVRTLTAIPAIDYLIQWIFYGKTAYELCATSRSAFSKRDVDGNDLSEEEEASRLALAQLYVMTQGQDVPAIYFNDLLGLENDKESYQLSGRPRDLNRHKNQYSQMVDLIENDVFTKKYVQLINQILKNRSQDKAFYPGSPGFQFLTYEDSVFVNHAWTDDDHSLVIGNILNKEISIQIPQGDLQDFKKSSLLDLEEGKEYSPLNGDYTFQLKPYGYLWLK